MAINLDDYRRIFHKVGENNVVFEISHQDTTDSTDRYYGYVTESGAWIIQKSHAIGSTKQYTYASGKTRTDYDALWHATTGRFTDSTPTQTFTTFDLIGDNL